MADYPTVHIKAKPSDFAKTVLMPGDPHRAKLIVDRYLENAVLVNDVRGVQGYTGEFEGMRVSVMASGMGIPSIGIYAHELFNTFGVENIIRIGSAGALTDKITLHDLIFAIGACTDSNYASKFHLNGTFAPTCDYGLLECAVNYAREKGLPHHIGNILSSDIYYTDDESLPTEMRAIPSWVKMGVFAVEMECASLYMEAARSGKRALCVCTATNSLVTGEELSSDERHKSLTDMIELALYVAKAVDDE